MTKGTYFGEMELLEEVKRRNFCQTIESLKFIKFVSSLSIKSLYNSFSEFETIFE